MSDFRREFPDFPTEAFPALPDGFKDHSWHNDACPSVECRELGLHIFIDYPDPAHRSVSGKQYVVSTLDRDGGLTDEVLLETDDWSRVQRLVKKHRQLKDGERPEGFYWVLYRGKWVVAQRQKDFWSLPGQLTFHKTEDFRQIGDMLVEPSVEPVRQYA